MTSSGFVALPGRRSAGIDRSAARETSDRLLVMRAAGKDVLELFGAPYWLPPEHVLRAAADQVSDPNVAHSQGMPALRRAIAERLERENGLAVDPETEVLVTNAAMHGLTIAFTTLLDPGDEVLLFAPAFYFYGCIKLAGGVPVYAHCTQETGWAWDAAALEAAVTPRTRLLVINTPTNPTGYVATREDLEAVADVARRHDLLVISDEAYDHMLFDGHRHLSIASLPGMRERTVSIFSFTKSYAMKQWRVGFAAGPATLIAAMRKILEWNLLECNHIAQHAALAALSGSQEWVADISRRMQHCRDLMVRGLADAPGISFAVPGGSPFLFVNVRGTGLDGAQFAEILLERHGVPMDPGGPFGSDDHVRLLFGGEDDVVSEAARRIRTACERITM